MGRNIKQGFSYFPLDVDIFSDIKIRKLIKNHSGRALSVYICVLAFIYKNGYYVLNDEDFGFIVSEQTGDKVEFIDAVLDYCVKVGLFSKEMFNEGVYTSKGVQERYLTMCKASKRNIVFSEYTLISSEKIDINSEKTPQSKGKESKVNISFLEKKKQKSDVVVSDLENENSESPIETLQTPKEQSGGGRKKFTIPTPEEVQAYCDERKNGILGQQFCDFYSAKGWKIGKEPMKDWKAAVRTWEMRRKDQSPSITQPQPQISMPKRIRFDEYGNEVVY